MIEIFDYFAVYKHSTITLIREVLWCNLIGPYVYMFFNAYAQCLQIYILSFCDGRTQLINLTEQLIDRTARSIDCTPNFNLMKHYNLESKILCNLPPQDIIEA